MTVHLFEAPSSPGFANFALKQAATDGKALFEPDIANFIREDLYVVNGLKSVATVEKSVSGHERNKELCRSSGGRLHRFFSKELLKSMSAEDISKGSTYIDINYDKLSVKRTLGIQWCIKSDSFQFKITLNDRSFTRIGVLTPLSSSINCIIHSS